MEVSLSSFFETALRINMWGRDEKGRDAGLNRVRS